MLGKGELLLKFSQGLVANLSVTLMGSSDVARSWSAARSQQSGCSVVELLLLLLDCLLS